MKMNLNLSNAQLSNMQKKERRNDSNDNNTNIGLKSEQKAKTIK